MRNSKLCSALAAILLAQGAFAQSQSSGTGTGTASSIATNQGANSSTNSSNSSAFQNSASNAVSTNSQNNGSASSVSATINIVPAAGGSGTGRQTLDTTSRSEQVLSGSQEVYTDYGGGYTVKNVPNVGAPPLVSSNDTCMGSTSGGVAVAGFGLTAGTTYTDEHCKRIKMSRELWNKGMKAASLAMDCMDPAARDALELTGYTCPQTLRTQRSAEEAQKQVAARAPSEPGNVVIRRVDARGEAAARQARGD